MGELQLNSLSIDVLLSPNIVDGFVLYTTAKMEARGFRFEDPISVDQVLMNLGYSINHEYDNPGSEVLVERELWGESESLRYYALSGMDTNELHKLGMLTKIAFLGRRSSGAVYDVAKAFLDAGHNVAFPQLNGNFNRLNLFVPQEGHYSSISFKIN